MTMTEYSGLKYDGMPKPPSLKDRIAALRQDDDVMAFLRTLRVTAYHWIAEKETGEPLTGGPYDQFGQMKEECEWLLKNSSEMPASSPIYGIRSVRILDALGAVVWSKEREKAEEVVTSDSTPA